MLCNIDLLGRDIMSYRQMPFIGSRKVGALFKSVEILVTSQKFEKEKKDLKLLAGRNFSLEM